MQSLQQIQPSPQLANNMRQLEENLSRADWLSDHINRLIGAFRRDDYADAAEFVKQATIVLAGYPDDVIEYVCSPNTGLQRSQKFAPVLSEIVEACEKRVKAKAQQAELDEWAEKKRRSAELRETKSSVPVGRPNLFVPEGFRNYDKVVARLKAEPERGHHETRVCQDGVRRAGVCVPLSWWEQPVNMAAETP